MRCLILANPSWKQPSPVRLVSGRTVTCRSCHITIHHHTSRRSSDDLSLWFSCPFCGEDLSEGHSSEEDIGSGASGCSGLQAFEDGLRLPPIEGSAAHQFNFQHDASPPSHHHHRHMAFIGSQITNFLLRNSGIESPLPPIKNVPRAEMLSPFESLSPDLSSKLANSKNVETTDALKITPRYPKRSKTRQEFLQEVRTALETDNYSSLQRFYMRSFDSFAELCALFKNNPNQEDARLEDPDLNMDLVYTVHDALKDMPSVIGKTVLKSMINSLLEKNKMIHPTDQVRSLFILIQSPLFASQSTFLVFAHVMNQIVSLSTKNHQLLVNWLKMYVETYSFYLSQPSVSCYGTCFHCNKIKIE
ncbi:hypothetical protein M8J76_004713 [Diaphorina citri]|nr:hypothetical protein M8J76_004713 [Diaphorina citri]